MARIENKVDRGFVLLGFVKQLSLGLAALFLGALFTWYLFYSSNPDPFARWLALGFMVGAALCFYMAAGKAKKLWGKQENTDLD